MKSQVVIKYNRIPKTKKEMRENATGFIRALTFETKRYIVQSMGSSPSAPGQPPGVDTGTLRASISTQATGVLSGEVYTTVDYAPPLEYGTSRMAARPFMMPGLVWAAANAERVALEGRWTGGLEKRQDKRALKSAKKR
jgi:hypothetical protein